MSEKELYCKECGADYVANEKCQCYEVAAEMDPARELDAVEMLISVAKKAMRIIDAANEEEEGPMAMPPPIVEDLREATYDLEDIWSLIPPGMLTMLRLEMYTAHFNAEAMREDGVEDLPAYNEHLKAEMEKQAEIDEMTLGQMTPRQEDGIEIDPMDDDGRIGAANPETLGELLLANQEDLAVQNLKFLMKSEVPVHETQAVGMTIKEVIDRYSPDVQVRCPYKDDCGEIDFGEYKTCPHSDYHKVGIDCFAPCPFHEKYVSCKPMEDFANEEDIS
jgi:hypothetical protein